MVEGLGGCSVGFVVTVWSIGWFLGGEQHLRVGDMDACGSFHGKIKEKTTKIRLNILTGSFLI